MGIYIKDVTITTYPDDVQPRADISNQVIALGDLHGNFLKLLHTFLDLGIISNMPVEHFEQMKNLYQYPTEALLKFTIEEQKKILQDFTNKLNMATYHNPGLLILLGDELADRGTNDLFTLTLLSVLHDKQLPFTILMSNHSMIALAHLLKMNPTYQQAFNLAPGQKVSLENYMKFDEQVKPQVLIDNYIKHLSLIGYQISDQAGMTSLTLYSHAPIDQITIKKLAHEFGISNFNLEETEGIIQCIDDINHAFRASLLNGTLEANHMNPFLQCFLKRVNPLNHTGLYECLWNRFRDFKSGCFPREPLKADVVHGHVGLCDHDQITLQSSTYYNLDNSNLGKSEEYVEIYKDDNHNFQQRPYDPNKPHPSQAKIEHFRADNTGKRMLWSQALSPRDLEHQFYHENLMMYAPQPDAQQEDESNKRKFDDTAEHSAIEASSNQSKRTKSPTSAEELIRRQEENKQDHEDHHDKKEEDNNTSLNP